MSKHAFETFATRTLGDGIEGGVRRWEASVELRVPLGSDVGVVGFCDAGDVNRASRFRFDYPQAAAGFGLRYYTLIGPMPRLTTAISERKR